LVLDADQFRLHHEVLLLLGLLLPLLDALPQLLVQHVHLQRGRRGRSERVRERRRERVLSGPREAKLTWLRLRESSDRNVNSLMNTCLSLC